MKPIPVEIKRLVAFHLLSDDPADGGYIHIKQLRLVNREFSIIAAEPLLSEIYLMLTSESFERMRKVSAHPSYAKFVRSLRYEPNGLKELDATDWPSPHHELYRTVFRDQEAIRQREHNRGLFTEAMARLPNLGQIVLNLRQMEALRKHFDMTTQQSWRMNHEQDRLTGVIELRSILLGAHNAGAKLKVLKFGEMDWRLFQLPEADITMIESALSHLNYLHCKIDTMGRHTDLENVRLCQFLSAAKNLRTLNIVSSDEFSDLKLYVGQSTWTFLSTVELSNLGAGENTLITFLERHAGTLQDLTLREITLVRGDWISTLPRVRHAVQLKEFCLLGAVESGNLCSYPSQHWCINCDDSWVYQFTPEEMARMRTLCMAITDYVLNGGDCPLLDKVTYPQGVHRYSKSIRIADLD